MAKALDEILQKYFGCSVPFRKDGELTTTGEKAMRKLEELLSDLEGIGVIPSASDAVRQLDVIVKGENDNDNENENQNEKYPDPADSVAKDDGAQDIYEAYGVHMRKAVAYINKQLEPEDVAIICAKVDKNFTQHMNPAYGIDDGKIIDLLEEYGQDNDLPEGWWEAEHDMDSIVLLIQFES